MVLETSRVKGLANRVALPAPKKLPQYRGAGLCYRGDGKWCVGLVALGDSEQLEWFDGLSLDEAVKLIRSHEKNFVYQTDTAVFGESA